MMRDILAAAFIAVAAIVPRIWILSATSASGLMADMVDYFDRARYLFDHGRLYPDAFRVPAYPIAVAGSFAAFGPGVQSARLLQCLILTGLAVATYALARRAMGPGRAMIASLIVAWYPGLLLYTVYVMAEPLFMLLVLLALLSAGRATVLAMFAAGIFAGLATLTRQAGAGVGAALLVWAACRPGTTGWRPTWGRRGVLAAALALGMAVAMAPWAMRNYTVFGRWMPLETTGGITFLMSHYEEATGRYLLSDWDKVHTRYLNAEPEEFTRNATAYRLGFEYIKNEPVRILKLVPKRLGYLFDLEGREHVWLYSSSYFGPRPRVIVLGAGWAVAAAFPLLVVAAIASLACAPRPRTRAEVLILWVLAVMIVQLLTVFGDPRFHLPLVPLLAVVALRPWTMNGERRSLLRMSAGVLVLALALQWWGSRLPTQLRSIERLAAPDGWQSGMEY
jgi:4-amino-4-deoxy-L-arabinose transferase-like glycosyltransferase